MWTQAPSDFSSALSLRWIVGKLFQNVKFEYKQFLKNNGEIVEEFTVKEMENEQSFDLRNGNSTASNYAHSMDYKSYIQ